MADDAAQEQNVMKTILIVEDDVDIAWSLTAYIHENTPYQTLWADNGLAALRTMRHTRPDLLVLDYRLPGLNGLELYDQLLMQEKLAAIPAILITANLPRLQLEAGHRSIKVLEKPIDFDVLLAMMDKLLAGYQ